MILQKENEAALAMPITQIEQRAPVNYDDQVSLIYRCMTTFSVTIGTVFTLLFFIYLFAFSWDSTFKSVLGFLP